MIPLNSRDSKPLNDQVADGLRRLLYAGAFAPGDRLPAAGLLAASLAVNPLAVRTAYQTLADEGLLAPQGSGGPQVTDRARSAGGPDRDALLKDWDEATVKLLLAGCTRSELQTRLKEVGA